MNTIETTLTRISLYRDDMIESKKHTSIEDVMITDFKITIDEVEQANEIVFYDGNKFKFLKKRP